ncbi:MAG TPA: FtsX-like permease family protein [Vicinamibacterales bacterium]
MLLASWAVHGLTVVLPADLPRGGDIAIDGRVLLFGLLATLGTGIVFGVAPALYASRAELATSLKDARRDGAAAGGRRRLRGVLVAAEVALALVLLAGAGLALRSFDRLNRVNPGFDASGALSVNIALPEAHYPDGASAARFYRRFQESIETQPGIRSAGMVMIPPLATAGGFGGSFSIIGRTPEEAPESMQVRPATPGYFETLRVPLRRGRLLSRADRAGAPDVAVISEEAARRFWPDGDAIGQRIRIHVGIYGRDRQREIVGIVGDVRTGPLARAPRPVVYVPHAQFPSDVMTLFVRGEGNPLALVPMVETQLAALDRDVALTDVRPADTLVSMAVAEPRFRVMLLGLFAVLALSLAAIGLYGVVTFSVNQRRTELGLRLALGARRSQVLRLVVSEGLAPVGIGMACGVAAAVAITRIMSGLLYETPTNDPVTYLAVSAVLGAVAMAACLIPARRAMRVDPIVAMRGE